METTDEHSPYVGLSGGSTITARQAYDAKLFTSTCCGAFNIYHDSSCVCSHCGKTVATIDDDDLLTISVRFNDNNVNNVSTDVVNGFLMEASQYACDPTLELSANTCPKCKSYSRFMRDPAGRIIFICSNPECRNVFI